MKIINKSENRDEILGVDADIVRQVTQDSRLTLEDIGVYITYLKMRKEKKLVKISDMYEDAILDTKGTVDCAISRLCSFGYIKLDDDEIIDLKNSN